MMTRQDGPQFGELVRQHRIRLGLTQRALADFSTISVRAIRDLEQGRATRPRQDTVRLIADGLRLGPRSRADLETAAGGGCATWALKAGFEATPPAPPAAVDPLLGRETEVSVIESELLAGTERLINLVGLTGVGKTRLALEVAGRLHTRARMPVLWCASGSAQAAEYRLADGAQRVSALVYSGIQAIFTRGAGPDRSDINIVTELIGDRPTLLVLDDPGPPAHPEQLLGLLRHCPGLRILMTTRQPAGLPGERPFLLAPLETPTERDQRDVQSLARVPAVRLFVDRVRRIRPGFELTVFDLRLVADICRSLDGLPQALRAAATWLLVYDLPQLHANLAGEPHDLLGHLGGADGGLRLAEALRRCVDALPATEAGVLSAVGDRFDLDDVVALTGRSLPECGRLVRSLLLHGLVAPDHDGDRSRFKVLHLVRAHLRAGVPC